MTEESENTEAEDIEGISEAEEEATQQDVQDRAMKRSKRNDELNYKPFFPPTEVQGIPLWLITFTDIMALMLTFFVLLYTMSVPKEEVWEEFTEAVTQGVSISKSARSYSSNLDTISINKLDMAEALSLDYLEALLHDVINRDENLNKVVIIPQNKQLILSLPSDLLFEVGKADINTKGKRALFALGGPLSRIRNRIEVVGHADPRPIENRNGAYKTNWELSLARAGSVAGALKNVGYSRDVILKGLSSGRYDDLEESVSEEERLDLSRRVDIVIMRDDGSQRLFSSGL